MNTYQRRTVRVLVAGSALCGALFGMAVTLLAWQLACRTPEVTPPAQTRPFSSSYGPRGQGCWTEQTAYGPERICGELSTRVESL